MMTFSVLVFFIKLRFFISRPFESQCEPLLDFAGHLTLSFLGEPFEHQVSVLCFVYVLN